MTMRIKHNFFGFNYFPLNHLKMGATPRQSFNAYYIPILSFRRLVLLTSFFRYIVSCVLYTVGLVFYLIKLALHSMNSERKDGTIGFYFGKSYRTVHHFMMIAFMICLTFFSFLVIFSFSSIYMFILNA